MERVCDKTAMIVRRAPRLYIGCRHERTMKIFFLLNWGGPSANFKKTEGARLQIFKKLGGPGPPQAPMDGTPMVAGWRGPNNTDDPNKYESDGADMYEQYNTNSIYHRYLHLCGGGKIRYSYRI